MSRRVNFIFFNRAGGRLDSPTYRHLVENKNTSIELFIKNARVSAINAVGLSVAPSNYYAVLLSPSPNTPFARYSNYLVIYVQKDVFLFVPPADVGVVAHEYEAREYSYDAANRIWTEIILPGGQGGQGGGSANTGVSKGGVAVSDDFASGNYVTFDALRKKLPVDGRGLDLTLGAPLFFGINATVPFFTVGSPGLATTNTTIKTATTQLSYSTDGLGGRIPPDVGVLLAGFVMESRVIELSTSSETVLYTRHGVFRQDTLPLTPDIPLTRRNLYFHFIREVGTTGDWFTRGYSSLNTSDNITISGTSFNRRSLLVSSGIGISSTEMNYITLTSGSNVIELPGTI